MASGANLVVLLISRSNYVINDIENYKGLETHVFYDGFYQWFPGRERVVEIVTLQIQFCVDFETREVPDKQRQEKRFWLIRKVFF